MQTSYAVFDARSEKLRGGFSSKGAGEEWIARNLPFDLYEGGHFVTRVATAYERDLFLADHPRALASRASRAEFGVYCEL